MLKDYRAIRVAPQEEAEAIHGTEMWGWKLDDSREIYDRKQIITGFSAGISGVFGQFWNGTAWGQVHSYTDVKNFVTLRFSRDPSIPENKTLAQLEGLYWEMSSKEKEYNQEIRKGPQETYVPLSEPLRKINFGFTFVSIIVAVFAVMFAIFAMMLLNDGGATTAFWVLMSLMFACIAEVLVFIVYALRVNMKNNDLLIDQREKPLVDDGKAAFEELKGKRIKALSIQKKCFEVAAELSSERISLAKANSELEGLKRQKDVLLLSDNETEKIALKA